MNVRNWLDPIRLYNPTVPAGGLIYFWGTFIYPILFWLAIFLFTGIFVPMFDPDFGIALSDLLVNLTFISLPLATVLMTLRRLADLHAKSAYLLLYIVPFINLIFVLWLLFGSPPASSDTTNLPKEDDAEA